MPVQILASMCAGGLASCMFPGDITQANTMLSPQTSIAQGLFLEMFFTAELVFVVLMLAVEKSKDTFLAPVGIGLTLVVTMLSGLFLSRIFVIIADLLLTSPARHTLYRRLTKSSAQLWLCRGWSELSSISLDILARPCPGCCVGRRVLQICEIYQL